MSFSFQSKLPAHYWGECVLCAYYLINIMPIKSINNMTPFQKLYNEPFSLDNLKVLGCLCYVSIPKPSITKFNQRTSPCVFIGYLPHQKSYKVLDMVTKNVVVTRDIIFHEHHFPFHIMSPADIFTHYTSAIFLPAITPLNTSCDDFEHFDISCSSGNHGSHISASPISNHESYNPDSSTHDSTVLPSVPNPVLQTSQPLPSVFVSQSARLRHLLSYLSSYKCNLSQLDTL